MKIPKILIIFTSLITYSPIHELGHLLIALIYNFKILEIKYTYILVNYYNINSNFIKLTYNFMGFFITFYISLIIFFYYWKKKSNWWLLPYTWLMISIPSSVQDFKNIAILINNYSHIHYIELLGNNIMILFLLVLIYEFTKNKNCYELLF
jgi:hypothetical protein